MGDVKMRYFNGKHYLKPNDILIAPMRHGKTITKGFCVKEENLYYCDGDDCPYLKYQQEELEVKRILAGVAVYVEKMRWDELSHGVTEMRKGFQQLAETLKEVYSRCD